MSQDETYGTTFWATTDQGNVMFNSKRDSVLEGTTIVAEEYTEKFTKKDNKPYLRLSKTKISDDSPNQASIPEKTVKSFASAQPTTSTENNQLNRIESSLQELHSKIDRLIHPEDY